jgi:hypothetical protein
MLKIPPTPFIKGGDKKLPLPGAPRGLVKSAEIGTSRFFSDRLLVITYCGYQPHLECGGTTPLDIECVSTTSLF